MITTVTLNPALDKFYRVQRIHSGTVMRVQSQTTAAGGKGLNVARVAQLLGEEVCAIGLLGGFNGQFIRAALKQQGVPFCFTETAGETRCNINIWETATQSSTEYLEPGTPASKSELNAFLATYEQALATSDTVVLAGSAPAGVPANFYARLIAQAHKAGCRVLLDTSDALLREGIAAKPTFIKPNEAELHQLLGLADYSISTLTTAAQRLHRQGIPIVAVSLGSKGVVVACESGVFRASAPPLTAVNTVGCGDSMVAGFAAGLRRALPIEQVIRLAVAVSAANALTQTCAQFNQPDLERLQQHVLVEKVRPM